MISARRSPTCKPTEWIAGRAARIFRRQIEQRARLRFREGEGRMALSRKRGSSGLPGQPGFCHGSILVPPASVPANDHPTRDLAIPAFTLSYRDVEDLLAQRGIEISYETVRRWVLKFGPPIARKLGQGRPRPFHSTGP